MPRPPGCDDDDDCDEQAAPGDDDGCSDDGGGSDCGCELPDGVEDGDCDAFESVDNARYVGRGVTSDEFFASTTSSDWQVLLVVDSESEVGATPTVQQNSSVDYSATVEFEDEAGVCKLKWIASNTQTGVVYRRCFSVNVEDYEPVEFLYQTFIPCQAIKTPHRWASLWTLPLYFGGDEDRYNCDINAASFGTLPSQTHRSSYHTFIRCEGLMSPNDDITGLDCDDDPLNYTEGELTDTGVYGEQFGLTKAFAANQVAPGCGGAAPGGGIGSASGCDYELIPDAVPLADPAPDRRDYQPLEWYNYVDPNGNCYLFLLQSGLADGANGGYALRIEPNKVIFRYSLHASNPLIGVLPSPAIDVYGDHSTITFTWSVDGSSGEQTINWVAHIEHDRFPAHQMYFGPHRDQPAMSFDPTLAGYGPLNLVPTSHRQEFSSNGEVNQ